MINMKKTNVSEVVVIPEKPWLRERTAEEEYRKAEQLKESIERHVDDIGEIFINTKYTYEDEKGIEYNTLYDALAAKYFDADDEYYEYRYVRPSDNGVGTRGHVYSFKELIEEAYQYPWSFEIKVADQELTKEQNEFLQKVIEAGLQEKSK